MNDTLKLVAAINTVLQLARSLGLSWTTLRKSIDRAKSEGRPFGLDDLEHAAVGATDQVNQLRQDIEAARAAPPAPADQDASNQTEP